MFSVLPSAAVDLEYVDTVLREFAATGLKPQTIMFALVVICLVCVLGVVAMYMNTRKLRLKAAEPPVGWITETSRILELLQSALDNRSKVDLSFHSESGDQARKSIFCAINDITSGGLLLELPAMINAREDWVGRRVDCYFRVPFADKKDRKVFYYFLARIAEVRNIGKNITAIRVGLPDSLVLSQRRSFMRISPPAKDVHGVTLLPETKAGLKSALKWFFVPAWHAHQPGAGLKSLFRLEDISGEGMKVFVRLETKEQKEAYALETGKNFYALLHLRASGKDQPKEQRHVKFLFLGVARQVFHNPQTGETELGMQFVAVCEGVNEEDGKPIWKMVRKLPVNELEQWVVDKYLEVFREQGLELEA